MSALWHSRFHRPRHLLARMHRIAPLRFLFFGIQLFAWSLTTGFAGAQTAPLPPDHAERMSRGLRTFDSTVKAGLKDHCLTCHGGEKTKGELNLVTREGFLQGGAHGPVITPFDPTKSRLLRLLRHAEDPHMPDPGSEKKIPSELLQSIESWISDGAPYSGPLIPGAVVQTKGSAITESDRQWWAFQPLRRVDPPQAGPGERSQHPIDRFLVQKAAVTATGAHLAPRADAVTLLRRAYLDLTGLPPSMEEVRSFTDAFSAGRWQNEVRRLLNSPHYGERWARHWLDLARFAESSGFEHDYDREGAFHYRDFVIRALNLDLPYDTFVQWQLAGDEMAPENPLAMTATGFLGAGVFPTQITANEVERTRYDAMDDMLSTAGSAFLGLSFGCARCHDHKYDPIPSQDYYRMLATFTTTVRSVVDLDLEPEKTRREEAVWTAEQNRLKEDLATTRSHLKDEYQSWFRGDASRQPFLDTSWTLLNLTNLVSKAGAEFREQADHSQLVTGANGDQDEYTLRGFTSLKRIRALRLEALSDPSMTRGGPGRADNGNFGLSRVRMFIDKQTPEGMRKEEIKLANPVADFEQNQQNLSIASSLDEKDNTGWAIDPQFGKTHRAMFELSPPAENTDGVVVTVVLRFHVNGRHNIGRFRISLLQDGTAQLAGEPVSKEVVRAYEKRGTGESTTLLARAEDEALFEWWLQQRLEWKEHQERIAKHTAAKPRNTTKVLICAEGYPALRMHTQGADFFKETYFLKRGNTDLKNGVAEPGFLQVLNRGHETPHKSRWISPVPEGARFSGRRSAFARWMTDVNEGAGALLARVMVNRLWQHHFGRGIVTTPSDFGHTGTPPSHPELLDWLAGQLIESGWRLKAVHELIMTSEAYQQAVMGDENEIGNGKTDRVAEDHLRNMFLRQTPRRLEGEVLRDTLLAVSGELDPTLYGPGTKDPMSRRRSIYFTVKRSQLMNSMVAFDQPEPLVSQGVRSVTTVPPQALFIMNSKAMRSAAENMAQRLLSQGRTAKYGPGSAEHWNDFVVKAYEKTLNRPPRPEELEMATTFLKTQFGKYRELDADVSRRMALADYVQVLFGLNELVYQP